MFRIGMQARAAQKFWGLSFPFYRSSVLVSSTPARPWLRAASTATPRRRSCTTSNRSETGSTGRPPRCGAPRGRPSPRLGAFGTACTPPPFLCVRSAIASLSASRGRRARARCPSRCGGRGRGAAGRARARALASAASVAARLRARDSAADETGQGGGGVNSLDL